MRSVSSLDQKGVISLLFLRWLVLFVTVCKCPKELLRLCDTSISQASGEIYRLVRTVLRSGLGILFIPWGRSEPPRLGDSALWSIRSDQCTVYLDSTIGKIIEYDVLSDRT